MILIGAKVGIAGACLVGGVSVISGTTTDTAQDITAATDAKTVTTLCEYAAEPGQEGSPPTSQAATKGSTAALARLGLARSQQTNARAIVQVAASMRLPDRAAVIGVATALQESDLDNQAVGDHGTSFGLFQQKPTSGYGTRTQLLGNPTRAARGFFNRLRKIPNWQQRPLTVTAQLVQKSAYPNAYAKHEERATAIVRALSTPAKGADAEPAPHLSDEQEVQIEHEMLVSASAGRPRAKLINDLTRQLKNPPLNAQITKYGHTAATDLCAKLTPQVPAGTQPGLDLTKLSGSPNGLLAVKFAMSQIGVKYSWGGGTLKGPSEGFAQGRGIIGFDCSSLTRYAWHKAGVTINRVAADQFTGGQRIPRSQLQPGDLIFFADNPRTPPRSTTSASTSTASA